jgi:hypothetical protein
MVLVSAAVLAHLIGIVVSEGPVYVICQRLESSWDALMLYSEANRCYEVER